MRADQLGVVQFIHPGKEQLAVKRNGWCPWNAATRSDKAWPHRRKFLVTKGSYFQNGSPSADGLVGFWGEWEACSTARILPRPQRKGEPYLCHLPAFYPPASHDGLLDTDPFVFGDHFLYNGCQQHTAHNKPGGAAETFLRRLSVGSMVMFGASIGEQFVLDTAFVVGDFHDYPNGSFEGIRDLVPPEYLDVTLQPQALGNLTVDSFRLYRGATAEARVGEMFSFTPCVPFKGRGFVRPVITLPGVITPHLKQGKKFTPKAGLEGVREVWTEVKRQVEAAGCSVAHRIELKPWRVEREQ